MKMTKYIGLSLISLLVLGTGATGEVKAEELATKDVTAKTDADVTFITDDGETDPEKPDVDNPEKPGEPGVVDPNSPGSPGNGTKKFNINWVSDFNFGDMTITGQTMKKFAQSTYLIWEDQSRTEDLANFIQITDNRGTNTGWIVSVAATPFYELDEDKEKTETILEGAQLLLKDGHLITSEENTAIAPTISVPNEDILFSDTQPILTAADGQGQGTWTLAWGGQETNRGLLAVDSNGKATAGVELSIPVSAKPKADASYRSEVTWTLADTPTE